jgi:hypothetical protein
MSNLAFGPTLPQAFARPIITTLPLEQETIKIITLQRQITIFELH